MKRFNRPEIDIIAFNEEDIIVTSQIESPEQEGGVIHL